MERIYAGHFVRINPYNHNQRKVICLTPETVDAIVFWSKNPEPLIQHLPFLDSEGYRYYFQFTLNHYPQLFEPKVPDLANRLSIFKQLSNLIGPDRVIWRYDPIILSNHSTEDDHIRQFEYLAGVLSQYTRRVVISFFDVYPKVQTRLSKLQQKYGIQVTDITGEENSSKMIKISSELSSIASSHQLEIFTCAEKMPIIENQISPNSVIIQPGSCIDSHLLNQLFSLRLKYQKDRTQRNECLCTVSVDMGEYNTCRFNCVYCYANRRS